MAPQSADPTAADGTPDGHLVFVIDDEAMIRDLAKLALQRQGYEIETAASAPEALQRFDDLAARLAAVIVDKNLPGSNGMDLIGIFREKVPGLPALVISGEILSGQGDDGLSQGGPTRMVGKPFRLEELGTALGEVIAARGG